MPVFLMEYQSGMMFFTIGCLKMRNNRFCETCSYISNTNCRLATEILFSSNSVKGARTKF